MKQFQSLWMMATRLKRGAFKTELSAVGCALVVLVFMLAPWEGVIAQQQPSAPDGRKAQLEAQKLELEVKRLGEDQGESLWWLAGVLGFLGGVVGSAATIGGAWLARRAALDKSVHEKRLESYPRLVKAAEALALHFPPQKSINQKVCRAMGEAMRAWYFGDGGLLMSTDARQAYFDFARALTRAYLSIDLRVPLFPKDADLISVEAVEQYRRQLSTLALHNVNKWDFGVVESEMEKPDLRFKDFVFLQKLSSDLRTKLCEDLRSRKRPSW